jgi:hypothetical protein
MKLTYHQKYLSYTNLTSEACEVINSQSIRNDGIKIKRTRLSRHARREKNTLSKQVILR